jgi:hypothetical protein
MEFGISLPTDPPIGAQVEKAKLAEASGFTNVWCWDTHILMQEYSPPIGVTEFNMYTTFEGPERVIETYGREVIPSMAPVTH